MKNWWISWYHPPGLGFELRWPWWWTGVRCSDNYDTICAAVKAETPEKAMALVAAAMDAPADLEWRFCSERPGGWSPFGGRFPKAGWMEWD